MREYRVLESVNVLAAGRFVALVKGELVQLTAAEADDLLRAAYVEPLLQARTVETAEVEPAERAIAPAQDGRRRKGSGREGSGREGSGREGSGRKGSGREGSGSEGSSSEA